MMVNRQITLTVNNNNLMTLCCNWIEYRQLMLIKDCKEGQPKLAQNQESKPIQDLIFLR